MALRPLRALPALPRLPTVGGRAQQDELSPFMPTEEEVALAREEEEGEQTPLFMRLLAGLDRIFGGQMVKGLLAGTGEPGIADNVMEFVRKNPLFQIADIVLPGFGDRTITGQDVSFSDVRKALGDRGEVDTGIGNFIVNLAGEILTDPSTFLFPFGAVARGGAGAAMAGAGVFKPLGPASARSFLEAGVGAAAGGVRAMGPLAEAAQVGMRSLLTFGVPFVPSLGRFVVPLPRGLDLTLARGLERWGEFMRSNGLTGWAFNLFSQTPGVVSAGARAQMSRGLQVGSDRAAAFLHKLRPAYGGFLHRYGDTLLSDGDSGRLLHHLVDLDLEKADLAGSWEHVLGTRNFEARQTRRLQSLIGDDAELRTLWEDAQALDPHAIHKLYNDPRGIPLTEEQVRLISQEPRFNIDVPFPTRMKSVEERIVEASQAPVVGPASDLERTIVGSKSVATEGSLKRAELAERLPRTAEQIAVEEGTAQALDIYRRLRETQGDEFLDALADAAVEMKGIMRAVGDLDMRAGFINQALDSYIPRDLSPEVRELIAKQLDTQVDRVFGRGARFEPAFAKHRKTVDFTVLEANMLFWHLGTKSTGNVPLKALMRKDPVEGMNTILAKIFPDEWVQALQKNWTDPMKKAAGEFFSTNPALEGWRRIQRAANARESVGTWRTIYDPKGYLVDAVTDPLDDAAWQANLEAGRKSTAVWDPGKAGDLLLERLQAGKIPSYAVSKSLEAEATIAREMLTDELDFVFRTEPDIAAKKIDEMRRAAKLTTKSPDSELVTASDELFTAQNLKSTIRWRKELEQRKLLEGADLELIREQAKAADARIRELRQALSMEIASVDDFTRSLKQDVAASIRGSKAEVKAAAAGKLSAGEFQDQLRLHRMQKAHGILPLDELRESFPEQFERLRSSGYFKDAKIHWIDADKQNQIDKAMAMLKSPRKTGQALGWIDKATWWWKAWTVLPAMAIQTRTRDVVSNHILLTQAGVSPVGMARSFPQAWKVTKAFNAGMKGDMEAWAKPLKGVLDEAGNDMRIADFFERLQAKGLLNAGYVRDVVQMSLSSEVRLQGKVSKSALMRTLNVFKVDEHPFLRGGFTMAEFLDNQSRISGVLAHVHSGQSLDDAIELVRQWSYNPSKSMGTSFEKNIARRAIPFVSWMKFAINTEMQAAFTRPGTVAFWEKLHSAASAGADADPETMDRLIPEWIRDGLGIPWRRKDGELQFFVLGSYVPIGELAELANAIEDIGDTTKQDVVERYFGERMNPFFQKAVETLKNESFFTQRNIEDFDGELDTFWGVAIPKKWRNHLYSLRWLNEVDRYLKTFNGGDTERLLEQIATGAFGPAPKLRSIQVEKQLRRLTFEGQMRRGRIRGLMRKQIESGDPLTEEQLKLLRQEAARALADEQRRIEREEIERGYGQITGGR